MPSKNIGVPSGWLGRLRARPQPSARDSFPLVNCGILQKRGQRGALAAVCTPTLKSASKKHQNCAPPSLSTAYGTLKVVKRTVSCVCIFSLWQRSFPSPLYVTWRLEQATREFLVNLPKVRTPFPTFSALFKLPKHLKCLKAPLITNVTHSISVYN